MTFVFVILLLILLGVLYFALVLTKLLVRNFKAHKFFEVNSPGLPVVPKPDIISGHGLKIIEPPKNWKLIEDLHEKYGPTFGYYMIHEPWVSTKDLDLIKLIELDEARKHLDRPTIGAPDSLGRASLFFNNGPRWRPIRQQITHELSNIKVRSDPSSSDIESVLNKLAESLDRRSVESISGREKGIPFVLDVKDMSKRYTMAAFCAFTFNQPDVVDFDSERDDWVQTLKLAEESFSSPLVYISMASPDLRPLCRWLNRFTHVGKLGLKVVKLIDQATESIKLAHEQSAREASKLADFSSNGSSKRRLLDVMNTAVREGKFSQDQSLGNMYFLILAGVVTTADVLTCLLWHLARDQLTQDELRRAIIEQGIDADYVTWCINEAIRYHPPVPLGVGRILGEDVESNGLKLAKGTYVMPSIHAIHHDPNIWPEPERFKPDRWRDRVGSHPAAFMGFGLGPRNCPGGKLALHEIRLFLAKILFKYQIETCPGTAEKWSFSSPGLIYTILDGPILLRFRPLNLESQFGAN